MYFFQVDDRQSDALTKVFLLVSLLYPGLTNKIFEGLICRDLGGDPMTSVLEVDYTAPRNVPPPPPRPPLIEKVKCDLSTRDQVYTCSVVCEEDKALQYMHVQQFILIVICPIGLPARLYVDVWMSRSKDLILAEDEDTLKTF